MVLVAFKLASLKQDTTNIPFQAPNSTPSTGHEGWNAAAGECWNVTFSWALQPSTSRLNNRSGQWRTVWPCTFSEAAWQTRQSVQHPAWKDTKPWINTSASESVSSRNINKISERCISKGCQAVTVSQFYFTLVFRYSLYWTKLQSESLHSSKHKAPSEEIWTLNLKFQVSSEICGRAVWSSDTVHTHLVLSWPDWLPLTLEKAGPFY